MGYSGWWHHCQAASWTGKVDQSVGMVIVDHQGSIQWLQSWEEHGWQLGDSHDQEGED